MRISCWYFVRVPKAMLWHMCKVSAWNSHHKCDFWCCVFSRDYFGELLKRKWNTPLDWGLLLQQVSHVTMQAGCGSRGITIWQQIEASSSIKCLMWPCMLDVVAEGLLYDSRLRPPPPASVSCDHACWMWWQRDYYMTADWGLLLQQVSHVTMHAGCGGRGITTWQQIEASSSSKCLMWPCMLDVVAEGLLHDSRLRPLPPSSVSYDHACWMWWQKVYYMTADQQSGDIFNNEYQVVPICK